MCIRDSIITSLDRDGSILDTDKSIWFQGRAAWTLSTLYNTVEKRSDWIEAAGSCLAFLEKHGSVSYTHLDVYKRQFCMTHAMITK